MTSVTDRRHNGSYASVMFRLGWLTFAVLLFVRLDAQQDYAELLRLSSQHEKEAMETEHRFQFLERTRLDWGSETRSVIETPKGRVDRIIAFNDQPLAEDQELKQQQRLKRFLRDHAAFDKEASEQREDDQRRELLVSNLPEAFLLEFAENEPNGYIKFSFKPNPRFSPKTREAQIFKGMRGWVWIDPDHQRIVRAQGELFQDVNFGWGILGRLYKGGRFEVVQEEVTPGVWRITTLDLDFKGRIMLFSSLRIYRREESTNFVPTPAEMDAREALSQLLSESQPERRVRENGPTESGSRQVLPEPSSHQKIP